MKRILAALLTALMLLTFLPLASPPAKAEFDFNINCSLTSAFVGETFQWYINGETGSGYYEYYFSVYKDGESFDPENTRSDPYRFYTPPLPGKYQVNASVYDRVAKEMISKFSSVINVAENPNKITNILPLGATSLRITRNTVPGATDYWLFRSTDKIRWPWYVQFTGTTYTDTGLKAGTRYFYKIYYHKDGIWYVWFSPVVAGVPMGKASITAITSPAKERVKLVWSKAAGASGYQVAMATSASGAYKPVRQLTGNTVTLTGLKSGSSLYFKVRPYRRVYTTTYWGAFSAYRSIRIK